MGIHAGTGSAFFSTVAGWLAAYAVTIVVLLPRDAFWENWQTISVFAARSGGTGTLCAGRRSAIACLP